MISGISKDTWWLVWRKDSFSFSKVFNIRFFSSTSFYAISNRQSSNTVNWLQYSLWLSVCWISFVSIGWSKSSEQFNGSSLFWLSWKFSSFGSWSWLYIILIISVRSIMKKRVNTSIETHFVELAQSSQNLPKNLLYRILFSWIHLQSFEILSSRLDHRFAI